MLAILLKIRQRLQVCMGGTLVTSPGLGFRLRFLPGVMVFMMLVTQEREDKS